MKARGKRTPVAIITSVILVLVGLVGWVGSRPVARPAFSVKKFWDDYPGGMAMAVLCVSNGGNRGFLFQRET